MYFGTPTISNQTEFSIIQVKAFKSEFVYIFVAWQRVKYIYEYYIFKMYFNIYFMKTHFV